MAAARAVTAEPVAAERSILSNAMALAGGELCARAVTFLAATYLSRRLGPAGFGLIGFAMAFTGYFRLLVSGGMARVGVREIARNPPEMPTFVASILLLRFGAAAVAFAAVWVAAGYVPGGPLQQTLVRLSGLTLFVAAADVSWTYKAIGRSDLVAGAAIFGQVAALAGLLLLVRGTSDVVWVPVAQVGGDALAALVLLAPLLVRARKLDIGAALRTLRGTTTPAITRLIRLVIATFDVVFLGWIGRRTEVGYYTAAYRVAFLVLAVVVALHSSFWPAAARAEGPVALGRIVSRTLELASAFALPLVVGGVLVAEPLVVLIFGRAFVPAAPMLRWLLVGVACALVHGALSSALLASGATRRELSIMTVAAAANVVANLAVIPRYGAVGASIVTAASEGIALALCVLAGRAAGWHVDYRSLRSSLVACGVMAAVLLVLGPTVPLLLRVPAAAAAYFAVLTVVGLPADLVPHAATLRRAIHASAARW